LGLLNDAFAQGKISLQEYSDGLGQINERLLTANNLATIATSQSIDEVTGLAKRKEALALVTAEYAAGRLSVEQYAQAYEKLKGAYDNTPTAIVIDQATKQAAKIDDLKAKSRDLTKQVQDGTISWKTYGEAVKAIGEDYFPNYQANIEQAMTMTELLNKTIEDGSNRAAKALTENLTNAIRTGKGLFSSLKDFVNSILTDIANAIIRKQFVNPIVNALTGAIMPSSNGGFGNMFGNLFGSSAQASFSQTSVGSSGFGSGLAYGNMDLGGFLAGGGPAMANTPYIVGEAGPELFVPGANGQVVANDQLGSNIVVNLNLTAIDTQTGVEFLVKNRATITGVIQSAFNRNAKVGIA
jgi:hypothetical protein